MNGTSHSVVAKLSRRVFGTRATARRTGVLLMVLMALLATVRFGCANRFVYYPSREDYGTPADVGLRYEEVTFHSADGTALSGWFVPALGRAEGTVVQFHGNAQNMTAHFSYVSWLPQEGFNVFVFDYRGYGKSAGSPSREGVYEDCLAALGYVRSRPDVDPDRTLVLGQSLGGANAIAVLGSGGAPRVRAVAIDSSFYSYRLMARDVIRRVPFCRCCAGRSRSSSSATPAAPARRRRHIAHAPADLPRHGRPGGPLQPGRDALQGREGTERTDDHPRRPPHRRPHPPRVPRAPPRLLQGRPAVDVALGVSGPILLTRLLVSRRHCKSARHVPFAMI